MEKDANGKEVFLGLATVRVAGRQRPRNTHRTQTQAIPAPNRDLQNTKNVSYKRESLDPSVARHTIGVASTSDASASTGQDNKAFTDEQCTNGEGKITLLTFDRMLRSFEVSETFLVSKRLGLFLVSLIFQNFRNVGR